MTSESAKEKSAIAPLLVRALRDCDRSLTLRVEREDDFEFIAGLYAESRRDELAPVPWPEQAKREFLTAQCRLQRDHYAKHYLGAELMIIERAVDTAAHVGAHADPIGRIYVHVTKSEIRLMDIALLPVERCRGTGTMLVRALQDEAARQDVDLTLHVEPENRAQNIYRRLGFRLIEQRGIYDFLGWSAHDSVSTKDA